MPWTPGLLLGPARRSPEDLIVTMPRVPHGCAVHRRHEFCTAESANEDDVSICSVHIDTTVSPTPHCSVGKRALELRVHVCRVDEPTATSNWVPA